MTKEEFEKQYAEISGITQLPTGAFKDKSPNQKLNEEKIKMLLGTPEGKRILEKAMAQPLRCGGWDYDRTGNRTR